MPKRKKQWNNSKSSLRRKADGLCSQLCRMKGQCEWCGSRVQLVWAHGLTRGFVSLRYNEKNFMCLCSSCHAKVDANFAYKMEIWRTIKGEEVVEWLRQYRAQPGITTVEWYRKIIQFLQDELGIN